MNESVGVDLKIPILMLTWMLNVGFYIMQYHQQTSLQCTNCIMIQHNTVKMKPNALEQTVY